MSDVIDRESAAKMNIDQSMYDFRYDENDFYRNDPGLTEEIVLKLSKDKNDPEWKNLTEPEQKVAMQTFCNETGMRIFDLAGNVVAKRQS